MSPAICPQKRHIFPFPSVQERIEVIRDATLVEGSAATLGCGLSHWTNQVGCSQTEDTRGPMRDGDGAGWR